MRNIVETFAWWFMLHRKDGPMFLQGGGLDHFMLGAVELSGRGAAAMPRPTFKAIDQKLRFQMPADPQEIAKQM